jgi:hypothetical protein
MAGPSRQTRDSASTARATGSCSQAAAMCEATACGATGRCVAQAARNAVRSHGGSMRHWARIQQPSACLYCGCRVNEGTIVSPRHDSTAPANCGRGAGSRLDGGCDYDHSASTAGLAIRASSPCSVGATTASVDYVGLRLVRPHVAIHPSCPSAAGPNRLAPRAARRNSNRPPATGASGLRASHGSQAGAVVAGWHCHGLLHPGRSSAPPVWPVLHIPLRVTHGHPS